MICRCIVQLTVLGYILVPIFTSQLLWPVLLYASFMLLVGSMEASSRPSYGYKVLPFLPSSATKFHARDLRQGQHDWQSDLDWSKLLNEASGISNANRIRD